MIDLFTKHTFNLFSLQSIFLSYFSGISSFIFASNMCLRITYINRIITIGTDKSWCLWRSIYNFIFNGTNVLEGPNQHKSAQNPSKTI